MTTFRQNRTVAWRQMDGEAVLIDPGSGTVFVLNRIGSRIWELLEEPRAIGEIVDRVRQEPASQEHDVAGDVTRFLDELRDRALVESSR